MKAADNLGFGEPWSRDEIIRNGTAVAEWIADHFETVGERPVQPPTRPGDVRRVIPEEAPETGEAFEQILDDFKTHIVSNATHWNHPGFLAYFASSSTAAAALSEALAGALNSNSMLWRTGPSAAELEEVVTGWLRKLVGLPDEFTGLLGEGASTALFTALATARDLRNPLIRQQGMNASSQLRIYCSDETHSSVDKAAVALGLGRAAVKRIVVGPDRALSLSKLRGEILLDLASGVKPMAVVATAGTTSTSAFDPISGIADLCAEFGLWLHVDAAHGGAAALLAEHRHLFDGWDRADSIVINPHKWMFVPMDCSALFLRRPQAVRQAFSIVPDYLVTDDAALNYMDYGLALGRRFRALKLWISLRTLGRQGMVSRIREHIRLGQFLADWVDKSPRFERLATSPLPTVVFRFVTPAADEAALEACNAAILDRANATGEIFLSSTRIDGRYALRAAIGSLLTDENTIRKACNVLEQSAAGCSVQPNA